MGEEWAVWEAAQSLPAIEWLACALAFAYVTLAARNSVWCWPFAFVSSLLWAYQVWFAYALLFDAALNLFYAGMAVVGLARWLGTMSFGEAFAKTSHGAKVSADTYGGVSASADTTLSVPAPAKTLSVVPGITRMTTVEHFRLIGIGLALTIVLYVLAKAFTSAQLAGPDAVTTVFSVLATFLLIDRKLENWLYFVVIDAAYVWIYLERGSVVFALTFVGYTVMSVVGWWSWRRQLGEGV